MTSSPVIRGRIEEGAAPIEAPPISDHGIGETVCAALPLLYPPPKTGEEKKVDEFFLRPHQILDLVVGREAAGLAAGVFERAVDGDVELAGSADAQLDVGGAQLLEAIPHTEGLRLITSGAAILDQDFHAMKMGR
jgi:hypothetical protein